MSVIDLTTANAADYNGEVDFADAVNNNGKKILLGKGGFGEVVKVFVKGMPIARKVFTCDDAVRVWEHEISMLTQVAGCENIVAYLGHGRFSKPILDYKAHMPFIDFEVLNGESMWDLCHDDAKAISKYSSPASLGAAFNGMLEALSFLEAKGIVHRDIKPENIIQCSRGSRIVLLDFGIAEKATSEELIDGELFGTIGFHAPEVWRRLRISNKSDVFSMGVVFYRLLYGEKPVKITARAAALYDDYFNGVGNQEQMKNAVCVEMQHIYSKIAVPPTSRRYYPYTIPADLHAMVAMMLHEDSQLRPAASQLLTSDLFQSSHYGKIADIVLEKKNAQRKAAEHELKAQELKKIVGELRTKEAVLEAAAKNHKTTDDALRTVRAEMHVLKLKYDQQEASIGNLEAQNQGNVEKIRTLEMQKAKDSEEIQTLIAANAKAKEVEFALRQELVMAKGQAHKQLGMNTKVRLFCEEKVPAEIRKKIDGLQTELSDANAHLEQALQTNDALMENNESLEHKITDLEIRLAALQAETEEKEFKMQQEVAMYQSQNQQLQTSIDLMKWDSNISLYVEQNLGRGTDATTTPKTPIESSSAAKRARVSPNRLSEEVELLGEIGAKTTKYLEAVGDKESANKLLHWAWGRAVLNLAEEEPQACFALRRTPGEIVRGTSDFERWIMSVIIVAQNTYPNLAYKRMFHLATNRSVGEDQWQKIRRSIDI